MQHIIYLKVPNKAGENTKNRHKLFTFPFENKFFNQFKVNPFDLYAGVLQINCKCDCFELKCLFQLCYSTGSFHLSLFSLSN